VKAVARTFAWLYGKRGLLLGVAVLAAMLNAKVGGNLGFFDGA
jgi:hypothetical protein